MSFQCVLLLGGGGKEHAWAKAIVESNAMVISWAPQINLGIRAIASGLIEHKYEKNMLLLEKWIDAIDLAIIGQCQPILDGIGDWLEELKIPVFNPSPENARIEGSKIYMRHLLDKYDIQANLNYYPCKSMDDIEKQFDESILYAIKPDGITGGSGVKVYGSHYHTKEEGIRLATEIYHDNRVVLLEQLIDGIEFSLQGLANGTNIVFLPLVKDYKRAYDGDNGPNTGSMGCCSFETHSLPYLDDQTLENAKFLMIQVLSALKVENGPYVGAIYGQFMINSGRLTIIEFNARLGDPEGINALYLLENPLLDVIFRLFKGLSLDDINFKQQATCALYLTPPGFPENTEINFKFNIPENLINDVIIAYLSKGDQSMYSKFLTTHKRSIILIGTGSSLKAARENAYSKIQYDLKNLHYRTDIGSELIS